MCKKFDYGGKVDMLLALITQSFGAKQDQNGPHAFAACFNNVVPDTFDERDLRVQLGNNFLVQRSKVVSYYLMDMINHGDSIGFWKY